MRLPPTVLPALALLAATALPAQAIVKGVTSRDPEGLRRSVVRVENAAGRLCSGVLVAADLVLTAAHCVSPGVSYRVTAVDRRFRPVTVPALGAARHPSFVPGTTPADQPGVDLALVKLTRPLEGDFQAIDPTATTDPAAGEPLAIAGFGVTQENRSGSARVLRETRLVTIGPLRLMNSVVLAADPATLAQRLGAGACVGDSGGPVFRESGRGLELAGLVSWAGQARAGRETTACGGLTAVTPLSSHARWIASSARDLERLNAGASVSPGWTSSR